MNGRTKEAFRLSPSVLQRQRQRQTQIQRQTPKTKTHSKDKAVDSTDGVEQLPSTHRERFGHIDKMTIALMANILI